LNICFDKIQGGNYTLYIHRNFRNDIFEQALLDGEKELREHYRLTTIRSSKFARVYKFTVRFDDVDKRVYFKQYLCRSVWDFVKDFVRASRAERAFKATEMLDENGFDVPTIIAMGRFRHGFCHTTNFLVTLEIEDAEQIYQFISDLQKDGKLETRDRRELIRAFGQAIGKMHAKGIFHGDLRLGNILARQEKGRWRFFFLDNERTRKFYRLPARLRLKNLVQVNMFPPAAMSNTDRMRFFREYWAENEKAKIKKADLVEKVLKKTRRRLGKKEKSKKMNSSPIARCR
jgi:tRNA A-37 threonylcarbamoyl transferase component Bud32